MIPKRTLREMIELFDEYKKDLPEYNELLRKQVAGLEHRYTIELEKLLNDFKAYYSNITGRRTTKSIIVNKAIERISVEEIIKEIEVKEVKLKNEIRDSIKISLINCKKILQVQDKNEISRNNLINFLTLKYFKENSFEEILKEIDSENNKNEQ
ncbi:hypothetical protein [Clostridium cuniculi]|uniref:hypothetical protein n=1 Tax=Clostridium cuniculi TaxID=2548455 RepID=UPI0010553174|nr:hypothetical protein [Clostridium cuniculi]